MLFLYQCGEITFLSVQRGRPFSVQHTWTLSFGHYHEVLKWHWFPDSLRVCKHHSSIDVKRDFSQWIQSFSFIAPVGDWHKQKIVLFCLEYKIIKETVCFLVYIFPDIHWNKKGCFSRLVFGVCSSITPGAFWYGCARSLHLRQWRPSHTQRHQAIVVPLKAPGVMNDQAPNASWP